VLGKHKANILDLDILAAHVHQRDFHGWFGETKFATGWTFLNSGGYADFWAKELSEEPDAEGHQDCKYKSPNYLRSDCVA